MSDPNVLLARIAALVDELAATALTSCSDVEVIAIAQSTERVKSRLMFQGDRAVVELSDRDLPRRRGFRSLSNL